MSNKRQVLCIILDGWGYRPEKENNAIEASKKPVFDWLWSEYPHTLLEASGEAVGLPIGQIGNSEIGHMTIGAGRPIDTDLVRIGKALKVGELRTNPDFLSVINHVLKNKSALHIMGILSRGGVHGHEDHWFEVIKKAKELGVKNIFLHPFTDGRDTPPQIGADSLKRLEDFTESLKIGIIASVSGRFYAMDRDKNWQRTEKAKKAVFEYEADYVSNKKPSELLRMLYKEGVVDELLEPVIFTGTRDSPPTLSLHDGIIFTNFRADRARQLMTKIIEQIIPLDLKVVTMTEYESTYPVGVIFKPFKLATALNKEIAAANLTQAHIAETEKYPHVTYFVNGGEEKPVKNESHILIDSRKDIKTHDEAPLMRAKEIADAAIQEIGNGTDFIFINFANPDMVGHTANIPAIIEGVEAVDRELKRVLEALRKTGGVALVTSDHGNAELNIDPETGALHTAHTTNPVPAFLTVRNVKLREGTLADITPTILGLFRLDAPKSMTGTGLIV